MINNNIVKIKDEEFLELRDIIYKNSAIAFSETKKYLLENRLTRRINDLNFTSFKEYIYYLKYDANRLREMDTMINLVTINETYFFRERGQLDHLIKTTIPSLLSEGKRSLRIWSAACSTGEEPYTMAMMIKDADLYSKASIEIVAMDINSDVLNFARTGEYRTASFRSTPESFKTKYFTQKGLVFALSDDIKSKVKFMQGNLSATNLPFQIGKFDVIFCRNVLIYFDMDGKAKVINMFYNALNKPGYLYLGHSESIAKLSDKYKTVNFGGGMVHVKE